MASGSQNMTTYNARIVTGSNNAASPAGALLLSGAGRADDATGDTWIFLDSNGGLTNPWGIKHDQANNKLQIFGSGTNSFSVSMDTGDTYILGKVGIGYDPETSGNTYKLYVEGSTRINSTLHIFPNSGNYTEGIRIHSYNSWSDITLCGNDNTEDSGISANSWFIGNNNGNFYIARNGSPGSTAWLECVNNIWSTMNPLWIKGGSTEAGADANRLTTTSGMPGNMQYNTSRRGTQIYSNGIAFADPYNGNSNSDAAWIRQIEETSNNGYLEIAVGDDNGAEQIYVRQYKTDNTIARTLTLLDASGNTNFPGQIYRAGKGVSWYQGRSAAMIKTTSYTGYDAILSMKSTAGDWSLGVYTDNIVYLTYILDSDFSANKNTISRQFAFKPDGTLILPAGGRLDKASGNLYIGSSNNSGWVLTQDICSHSGTGDTYWSLRVAGTAHFKTAYGAVWNDYAEMRNVPKAQISIHRIYDDKGEIERDYPYAGHCVYEIGDGTMELTDTRLVKGCKIISDTFGFCIGETENCCTPIAVTGRVLAYPYESIEEYKNHIGDCVCSGPDGTVSIMTQEEKIQYPECIVGIISEIPTYDVWHCGNKLTKPINVNGRIWIYVR